MTDAEPDRLEGLARRAEAYSDAEAFRAAVAPDDRAWHNAIGARLGVALAVEQVA